MFLCSLVLFYKIAPSLLLGGLLDLPPWGIPTGYPALTTIRYSIKLLVKSEEVFGVQTPYDVLHIRINSTNLL